jgi:hypothetical protein
MRFSREKPFGCCCYYYWLLEQVGGKRVGKKMLKKQLVPNTECAGLSTYQRLFPVLEQHRRVHADDSPALYLIT